MHNYKHRHLLTREELAPELDFIVFQIEVDFLRPGKGNKNNTVNQLIVVVQNYCNAANGYFIS